MKKTIVIIGGGFCGTLTAYHLLENINKSTQIILVNQNDSIYKGIAYSPYSEKFLLNVIVSKMSAFQNKPNDFLDFVRRKNEYKDIPQELVANAFVSRKLYGEYLSEIGITLCLKNKINLTHVKKTAVNVVRENEHYTVVLHDNEKISADFVVLATGNALPKNPKFYEKKLTENDGYFQNPWSELSIKPTQSNLPIVILGNGLTMVDTIVGLQSEKNMNPIISISPNGYNILSHRHTGLTYTKLIEEIKTPISLHDLFHLTMKHIKQLRKIGASAEPVIDSIRQITPALWLQFSDKDKLLFYSRLRHLWGVARHRIPLQIADRINRMRIEQQLIVKSGHSISIGKKDDHLEVSYYDKKSKRNVKLECSRIINCTGPDTSFSENNMLLKKMQSDGTIKSDFLNLGLKADPLTMESVAVPELRQQTANVAKTILERLEE
jgi:uncharacterized NAD(P)/FAD-binding protein YdhS